MVGALEAGDLLCVSSQLQGTPEALWRPRPSPLLLHIHTVSSKPHTSKHQLSPHHVIVIIPMTLTGVL